VHKITAISDLATAFQSPRLLAWPSVVSK